MTRKVLSRILCIALVLSFVIPGRVSAYETGAILPKESHYLSSYSAYCYGAGAGEVQVWFDVTGTRDMEDIGALSIELYESSNNSNWTWVKSYTNKDTSGMLGHNDNFYGGHVSYQGVAGRYYKAKVCVWAGRNGGGDRRYFWTTPEKAR